MPLICGSDKTLLTTMAGNHSAWPVYLTIGNLPKHVRRKPSSNAVLLLALLPKFPKGYQASNTREGFHKALTSIFAPLKDAYAIGIDIDCADGFVRHCYPRLAAWIGNTPEQSLLTTVVGGFCPICTVPKESLCNQSRTWARRAVANSRKRQLNSDAPRASNQTTIASHQQEHPEVPFVERLWPGFDRYRIVAPDMLHQLHLSLFKHYLIPWIMELLKQSNKERPVHVKLSLTDEFDRRLAAIPRFQGLRALPDGRFSALSQLTGKEYRKIAKIFIPAVAPLLIHHPKHLEAIRAGIDFMMLASYESHTESTISYLQKALLKFDKLKWVFKEQRLGCNGQEIGHFNIPKLHSLTHYLSWIKEMGTLDGVNTSLTETLHKGVKEAYRSSNKVDYVAQMCFWDDRRLSVETREATLQYLANEDVGSWSDKICGFVNTTSSISLNSPAFGGLQYRKPPQLLREVEKSMEASSLEKAMISFLQRLKQQTFGNENMRRNYEMLIKAPENLMIRQAASVLLTYPSFQDEEKIKRHLIRCTKSWRGKEKRNDFVFFQNEVVGSKACSDAFRGKAIGKVLCLFEWDDVHTGHELRQHSLALIDIFLPMKPNVGQKNAAGKDLAYLRHHGMFLLEEQNQNVGRQIVDIACFHRAAHVIPTDIWENRWWLNNYIDLESYNDVYDRTLW